MRHLASRLAAAGMAAIVLLAGLAGCSSAPTAPPITGTGVVLAIAEGQQGDPNAGMVGAIGGAVVGGLLGSQIGGGTGQVIAATAGGVAGSMAGSSVASKASARTVWHVSVRFVDGIDRSFTVDQRPDYRPGDRVSVANGVISRLR